jgi:4-amino-4-deoxy-L-arabinose transferase-like glycosyltransferase
VALTLGLLAWRAVYLLFLSPYELVADEAHYWEWARHLDLSYYTKGPGVAWAIAASVAIFGSDEWSVRLPAAVAGAVAMVALARLGGRSAGGDARAGFFAAALFALVPALMGTSQFMTIDAPYLACWALASWAGLAVMQGLRAGRGAIVAWALLGAALGAGFLFKYTILLLVVGLVIFAVLRRRELRGGKAGWMELLVAGAVIAAAISPVVIWNQREGWPTVAHLLGHLGVSGGDIRPREAWSYTPRWTVVMIASQVGALGVPVTALVVMGFFAAKRGAREAGGWVFDELFLVCCAAPVLVFYLAVSLVTDVEANWPLAGFLTLLVLAGRRLGGELDRYGRLVAQWCALPAEARTKAGILRRKPETPWQIAWHWAIGWGVVAGLVISFVPYLPGLEGISGLDRIRGHRAWAGEVARVMERVRRQTGEQPLVVADHYGKASLLAFYLPGHPVVYSAARAMGQRPSAYDYFADTQLGDERLRGRTAVVVGTSVERWERTLVFDGVEVADRTNQVYIGRDYQGVRPAEPDEAQP